MRPSRRAFMQQMVAGGTATAFVAGVAVAGRAQAGSGTGITPLGWGGADAQISSGAGRAADDEAYWRWIASQFLTNPEVAYMNSGSRGPSPKQVIQAQFDAINAYDADRLSYATYVDTTDSRAELRARLAEFVGCTAHEIALTNNTTEGMAFGTLGLALKPGDEIIYTNHDHASGAQPVNLAAARFGARAVVVDLSDAKYHPPRDAQVIIDAFDKAITPRTRLISFCHINYTDGCVLPVKEICELARSRGALSLVDGAHPPGMMDLNIAELGCDMYAGAGHKWLLAGMLTGFFYIRRDILDQVWPLIYSGPVAGRDMFGEVPEPTAFNRQADTAARYEMRGSKNFAGAASLRAALQFHEIITPAATEARVRYLAGRVRERLVAIPGVEVFVSEEPALCCGMVSFRIAGVDPKQVNQLLWERHGIYIRDVTKPAMDWAVNRASMHIMVDSAQADLLTEAVAEIVGES